MKLLVLISLLFTTTTFAKQLGFTCRAEHPTDPVDVIFFNIVLDTQSYDQKHRSVDIFVYHLMEVDTEIEFTEANAFYVSPSESNPQFYIKAKNIPYYHHQLDFVVYPLAERMIGYTNLEIKKNGTTMFGTCERADYLDGPY